MGNKYSHAFDGLKEEVNNLKNIVYDAWDTTKPEYLQWEENKIREIADSSIDEFYAEYDPKYYDDDLLKSKYPGFGRHYDLYKAVEIGRKNETSNYFRFNSDKLDEHYGNGDKKDIIYSLAFRDGKHGGDPWRKPLFTWKYPSPKKIAHGIPILKRIQKKVDNTDFQGILNQIYEKNLDKLL